MTIAPKKTRGRPPTKAAEVDLRVTSRSASLPPPAGDRLKDFLGVPRGRPRKPTEKQRIYTIKLSLDAEILADLEAICESSGETLAALCHRVINEWLSMRRSEQITALRGEMRSHLREVALELSPELLRLIADRTEADLLRKLVVAAPRDVRLSLMKALKRLEE